MNITQEQYKSIVDNGVKTYLFDISAVLTADGSRLVVSGMEGPITVWDVANGSIVRTIHSSKVVFSIALADEGKNIVAHTIGSDIHIDIESGETLKECETGTPFPSTPERTDLFLLDDGRAVKVKCKCGVVTLSGDMTGQYTALEEGEWIALLPDGEIRCSLDAHLYFSSEALKSYR